MQNKIEAGLFIFLSVGQGDHAAYNRYSSYDHIPEFQMMRSQVHAQRYVATPELIAARMAADPAMAPAQYFSGYYHMGPAEETLAERAEHNQWVIDNAPAYNGTRNLQSVAAFDFVKARAAPHVPISADAVLYRPHTGVYVTMSDVNDPKDAAAVADWYERVHIPDMLSVKGFAGVWRFVSRRHPDFLNPEGRFLHIYFLDEEPAEALSDLRTKAPGWSAAGRGPETQPTSLVIESAFAAIADTKDAKYDWFD